MRFIRRHKILSAAMLVIFIVVIGVATLAIRFVASFSPVPLVISKETTYITEPLRSDGTPDYVAAINQRLSAGVTPENNAAVLFWKAAGPGLIKTQARQRYFDILGVPVPPERDGCFRAFDKWLDRYRQTNEQVAARAQTDLDTAMERPWSRREFPALAEWLSINERPMALVVAGIERPRRYDPLVLAGQEEERLVNAPLAGAQQCRDFARWLVLRAMLHAEEGKVAEAWSDLLACHQLARLVGQGPFFVEALVAIIIDGQAQRGGQALLRYAKLGPSQIAKMRRDLAALSPMPRTADMIDKTERLTLLDFSLSLDRDIAAGSPDVSKLGLSLTSGVDWNIVLRIVNSWFDRFAAAARKPTRSERQKAIDDLTRQLIEEKCRAMDWRSLPSLAVNRRQVASQQVGAILTAMLMPAEGVISTAEDRWATQFELTKLAFALAAYHAKHSRYPAKLTTLVPKYVNDVPKDIFNNNADLHYSREGDGYLLYSVGDNGKDDGGKTRDDAKNGEGWDDLAVRMSAAKP